MWTRSELKSRAKDVLRKNYWKAFLVSFILAIVGGGCSSSWGNGTSGSTNRVDRSEFSGIDWADIFPFIIAGIVIFLIVLAFILAFRIFLLAPLEAGGIRFFKQAAEHNTDLNNLGYAFGSGRYIDIVKSMVWRDLLNFLWFLLLFIPGIVKSYAYSQVPYILADNPNIGYRRALQLSNRMTKGHKFRIFVLDLSFLGWALLGLLAFFVGILFVLPYINATKAELYLALREEALGNGLTTPEELHIIR